MPIVCCRSGFVALQNVRILIQWVLGILGAPLHINTSYAASSAPIELSKRWRRSSDVSSRLRLSASVLDPDTAQISISSCSSTYLYTIIVIRYIDRLLLQHRSFCKRAASSLPSLPSPPPLQAEQMISMSLVASCLRFPLFCICLSCTKLSHPYTQLFAFSLSLSSFSDRTLLFSSLPLYKSLPISSITTSGRR